MRVNNVQTFGIVLAALLALGFVLPGCGGGAPPHVSYFVASSLLSPGPNGESRRLDVVCDISNGDNRTYTDVGLDVSFMDATEVRFRWPTIPPYGFKSAHKALELKFPVTTEKVLDGSFESLLDPSSGATIQYVTEVKSAVLSYKPENGPRREHEIGLELNRVIRESFSRISSGEESRAALRKKLIERLDRKLKNQP